MNFVAKFCHQFVIYISFLSKFTISSPPLTHNVAIWIFRYQLRFIGLVDFDFIAESLLPELCPEPAEAPLQVGAARYDCVIVPAMRTMRATTLTRLERFRANGGQVIFAGEIPSLVDAAPSERVHDFARSCQCIELTHRQVIEAVEPYREVEMNEHPVGKIAFAPFRVELGHVEKGSHTLDITAYGNRINAFGTLHNADATWDWCGPAAWRTTGDAWSYEYQVKPMGLLVAPRIQRRA